MREIKFRAWDEHNREIWYPETIGKGYTTTRDNLMQYTGLKDKNGVEIYEGDIVELIGLSYGLGHYEKYQVLFEAGIVCVHEHGALMALGGNEYDPSKVEVLGNIHENPELLEAKS